MELPSLRRRHARTLPAQRDLFAAARRSSGEITLRIPRVRCRCGAHVRLVFPVLEPRRRYWWDVWLNVLEGLAELRLPPLGPLPGTTDEIQADGLYGHLWGPLPRRWRDHTYALLIAVNRDPACPEKVLGAVLAPAEETAAYRSLADLLLSRGLSADAPLTVTSDGAQAIKSGFQLSFPHAQFVRCLWHLARLVADLAPAEQRQACGREVRAVLWAHDWDTALDRYSAFRQTWLAHATESRTRSTPVLRHRLAQPSMLTAAPNHKSIRI